MERTINPIRLDIARFKREYKRLHAMTTYARAMDKAVDIRADKWLSYKPLSREQLFDTPESIGKTTIIVPYGDGQLAHARSTYRGARWYSQRTVIARPTEGLAMLHSMGFMILDDDFVVIRQEPNKTLRFCVICHSHHEIVDFVQHKKYLNGLSYACKKSLEDAKRGIWRTAA